MKQELLVAAVVAPDHLCPDVGAVAVVACVGWAPNETDPSVAFPDSDSVAEKGCYDDLLCVCVCVCVAAC